MSWPTLEALYASAKIPTDVRIRLYDPEEIDGLPAQWKAWHPTLQTGTESVFLDADWLHQHAVTTRSDAGDVLLFSVERKVEDGFEQVGMMGFQWEEGAGILHARLGILAPHARVGLLGTLGFIVFETLGELMRVDVLMVRVTLASRIQQFMALRRGFRLCGVIPGVDRNTYGSTTIRVTEALFVKVRANPEQVLMPHPDALLPATAALLDQIIPPTERAAHPVADPP